MKLTRTRMRIICSVILGAVLLFAGTGKLLGQSNFTHALEGSFLAPILADTIVRYLPWLEIILGILLIAGIVPRITSIIAMCLFGGFMVNNSWALIHNSPADITCDYCFGIWENILGTLSPLQALIVDVVMLGLALGVLVLSPRPTLPWRATRQKEKKNESIQ